MGFCRSRKCGGQPHAEKDAQINRARQLLGNEPLPRLPRTKPIEEDAPTLTLIPIGVVDVCVLQEVQLALHERIGLPVLRQQTEIVVPGHKRDPLQDLLFTLRQRLEKSLEHDLRLKRFLRQRGITGEGLADDPAVVVNAYRHLAFDSGGTNALERFDTDLKRFQHAEKQWDIADLLTALHSATAPFEQNHRYFLGVTTRRIESD